MRLLNNYFLKSTLFIFFLFAAIFLLYSVSLLSFGFLKSFILAGFITYFNFALGFFSIKLTLEKSAKIFLIAVLGGMVLRLFLMLIMVFISLKFLDIRADVFIFVILFFYIVYLIIEIFYLFMIKGSN